MGFLTIYWNIALLLTLGYVAWMVYYSIGWNRTEEFNPSTHFLETNLRVSILVPVRNEAKYIEACLYSLQQQDYPSPWLEVIVLDDHSTDGSADIIKNFPLNNLRYISIAAESSYPNLKHKKRALSIGVDLARGDLILTIDGDCEAATSWVSTIVQCFKTKNPVCLTGPVLLKGDDRLFEQFQVLDLLGMMQVTAGGIHHQDIYLGNGANLAFKKEVFKSVGGYAGNEKFASGDDVFLIQKMAKNFPGQVAFLKSKQAIVRTKVEPKLSGFIQQRIRWATKNGNTSEPKMLLSVATVFAFSWILLWTPILSFFRPQLWWLVIITWSTKILMDWGALKPMANFMDSPKSLKWFLPSLPLHVLYISGIGLLANLKKRYIWKGRRVR